MQGPLAGSPERFDPLDDGADTFPRRRQSCHARVGAGGWLVGFDVGAGLAGRSRAMERQHNGSGLLRHRRGYRDVIASLRQRGIARTESFQPRRQFGADPGSPQQHIARGGGQGRQDVEPLFIGQAGRFDRSGSDLRVTTGELGHQAGIAQPHAGPGQRSGPIGGRKGLPEFGQPQERGVQPGAPFFRRHRPDQVDQLAELHAHQVLARGADGKHRSKAIIDVHLFSCWRDFRAFSPRGEGT